MPEKIFKIVFILFAIESILLIIGISFNVVSYGSGIATSLTQMGIILLFIFVSIIRFVLNKFDHKIKTGIGIFMIILMACSMIYLLVENTFKIHF